MRDRAIAYAEDLRKVNVDSPVLEYKDAVHEFAVLLKTPQAQACAEDIAIWVISLRGLIIRFVEDEAQSNKSKQQIPNVNTTTETEAHLTWQKEMFWLEDYF